jgi:hypothetical protein
MAWSIPMDTVSAFLVENDLGFILGEEAAKDEVAPAAE